MDQREDYQRLVAAIADGAIAVVGAGSSARVGYPPWGTLMQQIGKEVLRLHPEEHKTIEALRSANDTLIEAAHFESRLGRAFLCDFLTREYGPPTSRFDEFHEDLLRLPFSHYLTSNYDHVLETAHQKVFSFSPPHFDFGQISDRLNFLDRLKLSGNVRNIIHFHGSIVTPDQIVITLQDYDHRYRGQTWATTWFSTIFSVCQCVFVGCGLSHEDLGPLRFLTSVLGAGDPKHFAIMEQPEPEEEPAIRIRLRERYRVSPIFYPKSDHHQALGPFIKQLIIDVKECKPRRTVSNFAPMVTELEAALSDELKNDPGVLEAVRRALPKAIDRASANTISKINIEGYEGVTLNSNERTPLDDDLDDIFKYVKLGQPEIAIELYEKAASRSRLTDRLRYRIHANIGNAYYSMKSYEKAAENYSIAAALRDTRDAKALGVMVHVLREDYERARTLALELCQLEPAFPRAYWLLLKSLPEGTSFTKAESMVPEEIRSDAEVAIVLGRMASDEGLMVEALKYGKLALASAPEWPDSLLNLAVTITLDEKNRASWDIDHGLIASDTKMLEEAEELLNKAIQLIPPSDPSGLLPLAYLNRASTRRLLGKGKEADEDTRQAYRLKQDDLNIASAYAVVLDRSGDKDGAILLLSQLNGIANLQRPSFLMALFLSERAGKGDREKAAEILEFWLDDFANIPRQLAEEIAVLYVMVCNDLKVGERAKNRIERLPNDIFEKGQRDLLLGRALFSMGDKNGAKNALHRCVDGLTSAGQWEDRREAAILAHELGEYRESLNLWRTVISDKRLSTDNFRALRTAELARDEVFILEHCRSLRNTGQTSRDLCGFEVNALMRCHEQREAVLLLQSWLQSHPDDKVVRLHLWGLAMTRGEFEILENDPAKLPTVEEVKDATMGASVYNVLRFGLKSPIAAEFAYGLWRRFPDEMPSQFSLIAALLDPAPGQYQPPTMTKVAPNCAFRYQEMGTNRINIAVIETGPSPSVTRWEYGENHPLSQAAMGKSVGSEFQFQGHNHQILSIESKILFRAHECMEGFELAFPNNNLLKRMTVKPTDAGQSGLRKVLGEEVFEFLELQNKQAEAFRGLYQKCALTTAQLARAMGRSMIETIAHLAANPNLEIRCSPMGEREWQDACKTARSANRVAVDGSAIATIFMLDLHRHLHLFPFKIIIPDSVIQEIREVRTRFDHFSERFGYMSFHNGQPFFHEASKEQEEASLRNLDDLIATLRSNCEIVGGSAVLDISPELRDRMVLLIGEPAAHAIGLALHEKIPLWTDDFATGTIAADKWNIQQLWTQSVLFGTGSRRWPDLVASASTRMFLWGYNFTRLSPGSVFQLIRESSWDPNRQPAKKTIDLIRNYVANNLHNCVLTRDLIEKLWFSGQNEQQMRYLIGEILSRLPRHVSGPLVARPIYRIPLSSVPETTRAKQRRLSRLLRRWRCRNSPKNT